LATLLPDEPVKAFHVAANAEARVGWFLSGELGPLRQELKALEKGPGGRVAGIRLGLDAADNSRFKRQVDTVLLHTVVAHLKTLPPGPEPGAAELLIARTDPSGVVVRHYSSTVWPLLSSPRPVGSLGKVWVGLEIGMSDATDTHYCNRAIPGGSVRNSDGDQGVIDCGVPGAMKSVIETYAKSKNLPLLERLRRVPQNRLRELGGSYGLALTEGAPPDRQLVLGMAEARPADLLALFQAIGNGVSGRFPIGHVPHFIERVTRERSVGWLELAATMPAKVIDLSPRFSTPTLVPFLHTALSAPLSSQGTLAALGRLASLPPDSLAKSGTTSLSLGGTRDRWAAGSLPARNGISAFVLRIGTPDAETPLGVVSGRALAALVEPLLAPTAAPREIASHARSAQASR
jgi:hypothetical protein